ncbi:MAG: glycosyltransferase family 2 protein [Gorillibacterium sp.]|nr:glycosyltransferase family 2 protein [Gorillibacterium sp.]
MKQLTVFTPTYNRGYCLGRCYESLKRQTSKDFVWLIIDDGSVDDTKDLVECWMEEQKIEIRYQFQQNQGMHGAHNTAYQLIDTELNLCIDSDDFMPDDAVARILSFWHKYGNDQVSGLVGLDADRDGQVIGSRLPTEVSRATLFDLYNRHGVTGDKKLVYRSELTRQYPYPLFANENYVGLAYKYYKLDLDYELLLLNEVLCTVEYMLDGSSQNMFRQYRRNPQGFAFYRRELMKLPFPGTLFKFRQAIHYVSSSLIARDVHFFKETPCRGLTLLAAFPGFLLYVYIRTKTRREPAQ